GLVAEVENLGAGNWRRGNRATEHRCVPLDRTSWGKELSQRPRKNVTKNTTCGLLGDIVALQVEEQREADEHAVLGAPGFRRLTEEQVLERACLQRPEPRLHSRHVSFELAPLVFPQTGDNLPRHCAKTYNSDPAIPGEAILLRA